MDRIGNDLAREALAIFGDLVTAIKFLGTGNAASSMGAIEFLGTCVKEAGQGIAEAISEVATSINGHAEATQSLADHHDDLFKATREVERALNRLADRD